MAFVEPPMAWRTMIAFRNDDLVSIVWGCRFLVRMETALEPVSSAMRRREDDTAGAEAPMSGMRPNPAVTQAIVLAVPITPQVPPYDYQSVLRLECL